jgi:hypothetical protein
MPEGQQAGGRGGRLAQTAAGRSCQAGRGQHSAAAAGRKRAGSGAGVTVCTSAPPQLQAGHTRHALQAGRQAGRRAGGQAGRQGPVGHSQQDASAKALGQASKAEDEGHVGVLHSMWAYCRAVWAYCRHPKRREATQRSAAQRSTSQTPGQRPASGAQGSSSSTGSDGSTSAGRTAHLRRVSDQSGNRADKQGQRQQRSWHRGSSMLLQVGERQGVKGTPAGAGGASNASRAPFVCRRCRCRPTAVNQQCRQDHGRRRKRGRTCAQPAAVNSTRPCRYRAADSRGTRGRPLHQKHL